MRRRMIIGCLVLLLLSSCSDQNRVPSGILSADKMEAVLWDMIQVDQYSAAYLEKDSGKGNLKMENLRLYEQVFLLHDISRDEFRKSYKYYMDRPMLSQPLFDSLISRGNRLRNEAYSRPYPYRPPAPAVPAPAPAVLSPALVVPVHPPTPVIHLPDSVHRHPLRDSTNRHRDSAHRHALPDTIRRHPSLTGKAGLLHLRTDSSVPKQKS